MSLIASLIFTEGLAPLSATLKPLSHFQCSHAGNTSCHGRCHPLTLHTQTRPLMPSGAISASLSHFKMLTTGDPLIPWSMDESCISWATVASLISIFTDPPAQHPSKLFKQLGRWKTDSCRKGIFRVAECYVRRLRDCNASSKFETKGAADRFGSYS